ncbi:MAG TPA: sigma-70 family RNA polymerase sigma factor [Gemmatimonadaceae bacterium]|nr:sigma-70 family RNA polymerase sigma factor [Gemmatimonadaceae bacterium]
MSIEPLPEPQDPDALAALYARYAPVMMRVAYHLTGSRADAEDVLHDVFLGLPDALRRYEERGRLEAWLVRLTARAALTRGRRRRRAAETPIDNKAITGASPHVERVDIQSALRALPSSLRAVVVLKEIEGYSHAEIAKILGISVGASEVRLCRAMKRLREAL